MKRTRASHAIEKVATGIKGFDELTGGGLPRGRPTLVCGGPEGLLEVRAVRPSFYALELHLIQMQKAVDELKPTLVALDPISSFITGADDRAVKSMLVRLFDGLKMRAITAIVRCLTSPSKRDETDIGLSSLIDTWIEVRDIETMGERTRALYVIKSRGMRHSNQVRELVFGEEGVSLVDAYIGPGGTIRLRSSTFSRTRRSPRAIRFLPFRRSSESSLHP